MNNKGQFFSPDLIIAVIVFVAGLGLFFMMSNVVFSRVNLFEEKTSVDEVAHIVLNNLVLGKGVPYNWEEANFSDVNNFGIVFKRNEIKKEKLVKLIHYLDEEYELTKEKLGVGKFDFQIILFDFYGNELFSSSQSFDESNSKFTYDRIVLYDGELGILRGVVVFEW